MMIRDREIAAVIFDIDGTLVDSFETLCSVFNQGIRKYHLAPIPKSFLMDCFKKNLNLFEILREIYSTSLNESLIELCRQEILETYLRIEKEQVKPFPEVYAIFEKLQEMGIKIGIATGRTSPPEKEWDRFKSYGLDHFIDALVTSKEVARRKPAPDAILECSRRLKVPPARCLVIGDTESDVIAARQAGSLSVAVALGDGDWDSIAKENPDLILRGMREFSLFLDGQGSPRGGRERPRRRV
jgi:HAD superfamily hydrolase (TIGR01509 family)